MIIRSELAETAAALNTAHMMCAAARTAPKTRGIDNIVTMILTDDDLKKRMAIIVCSRRIHV